MVVDFFHKRRNRPKKNFQFSLIHEIKVVFILVGQLVFRQIETLWKYSLSRKEIFEKYEHIVRTNNFSDSIPIGFEFFICDQGGDFELDHIAVEIVEFGPWREVDDVVGNGNHWLRIIF